MTKHSKESLLRMKRIQEDIKGTSYALLDRTGKVHNEVYTNGVKAANRDKKVVESYDPFAGIRK